MELNKNEFDVRRDEVEEDDEEEMILGRLNQIKKNIFIFQNTTNSNPER